MATFISTITFTEQGNVRSQTTRAFRTADMEKILAKLSE